MENNLKRKLIIEQDSVCDRLHNLLLSENHSDVTFVVGEGDEQKYFRAHRLILSTVSDVFETMFYGSLPEGDNPVVIPDLHPDGFSAMLRYVYEGKVQFDSVMNAINTITVTNKYLLNDLRYICCSYLVDNVTPECACVVYETARLYEDIKMERAASTVFILKTKDVIKEESFLSAKQGTVEFILRQSVLDFTLVSESLLFDAVLRWGKANMKESETANKGNETNLRTVVQPLLPFIRFLSMTAVEFVEGPGSSGVLTDEEIASCLMNIAQPGSKLRPTWMSTCHNRREYLWSIPITMYNDACEQCYVVTPVNCFQRVITLDKFIILQGIRITPPDPLPNETLKLQVFNLSTDHFVSDCKVKIDRTKRTWFLSLKNPEVIYPGESFKLVISFDTVDNVGQFTDAESRVVIFKLRVYRPVNIHENSNRSDDSSDYSSDDI